MAESLQFVPVHLHGDLSYARHREEQKLAAKKAKAAATKPTPVKSTAAQLANEGIPARASGLLASFCEKLLAKITGLESRLAEVEKNSAYPAHMKDVERR